MGPVDPCHRSICWSGRLAEAFASVPGTGGGALEIALSVEKEATAFKTLKLRSFFRQLGGTAPPDHYDHLSCRIPLDVHASTRINGYCGPLPRSATRLTVSLARCLAAAASIVLVERVRTYKVSIIVERRQAPHALRLQTHVKTRPKRGLVGAIADPGRLVRQGELTRRCGTPQLRHYASRDGSDNGARIPKHGGRQQVCGSCRLPDLACCPRALQTHRCFDPSEQSRRGQKRTFAIHQYSHHRF